MDIELAAAMHVLGVLHPERLGELGVELLASGRDTAAVRELAGLPAQTTWRDADDVFERVLGELGVIAPAPRAAAYRVAEAALRDVTAGRVSPYDGAARIAYGPWNAAGMPDDLTPFYALADEWEDHPEYRAACEADIRRAAAEWLAGRSAHAP